jgi:lipopolysaccharide transport system ATP-binding protein
VGGNPAKFIRYRFSEEQRQDLLRIKWWEWDAEKINQTLPLLCSENIDTFIHEYRELNR